MRKAISWIPPAAEAIAAVMMAALFATFVVQITIRYTARAEWIAEAVPFLDPSRFGWTLEFCLALWVWIVFFGCATIVRNRDHVTFDLLYASVRPGPRRVFALITCAAICIGLLLSLEPTWGKFHFLRLKQTATLKQLVGDWIRMRDVYSVYMFFLIVVSLRYAWRAVHVFRHGAEADLHHYDQLAEDTGDDDDGTRA